MGLRPFHLAFPVHDLALAKTFYTTVLGCTVGRQHPDSCVFNFQGHQIVAHLVDRMPSHATNGVDGHAVPSMHFGLVMEWRAWHELRDQWEQAEQVFALGPYTRYAGLPGAQATMFIRDPSGNHLEFKSFKNEQMLFNQSLEHSDGSQRP